LFFAAGSGCDSFFLFFIRLVRSYASSWFSGNKEPGHIAKFWLGTGDSFDGQLVIRQLNTRVHLRHYDWLETVINRQPRYTTTTKSFNPK
jgi:hypothetical protein